MKKLIYLTTICMLILFACSGYEKSEAGKITNHDKNVAGRFQVVAAGPILTVIVDTKEGYAWMLQIAGDKQKYFQSLKFDGKYQSALEAVRAYSEDPLGIRNKTPSKK